MNFGLNLWIVNTPCQAKIENILTKIFTPESNSLQAELVSSARPEEEEASDTELTAAMGSSAYRKAARTFKAIARSDRRGGHGSR